MSFLVNGDCGSTQTGGQVPEGKPYIFICASFVNDRSALRKTMSQRAITIPNGSW